MRRVRVLFNDERSNYRPRPTHTCINWGSSKRPQWVEDNFEGPLGRWINKTEAVKTASNKLETFKRLATNENIFLPSWTEDQAVAQEWLDKGFVVLCRTRLNGHSGDGIVVSDVGNPLVRAPLFVQYVKKKSEFRVHVAFGKIIDVQQKRKSKEFEGEANSTIRNHQNGWVYCREDIVAPEGLHQQALLAIQTLGLDFGAVDIIWNQKQNKCYVLEVNTAPGLEGTTVEKYTQAFMEKVHG